MGITDLPNNTDYSVELKRIKKLKQIDKAQKAIFRNKQ